MLVCAVAALIFTMLTYDKVTTLDAVISEQLAALEAEVDRLGMLMDSCIEGEQEAWDRAEEAIRAAERERDAC